MTTLREAAQQALEFIRWGQFIPCQSEPFPEPPSTAPQIEAALKAALAEPVQEPVAWMWQHRETGRTRLLMPDERTATDVAAAWDVVGPLYLAPPQRKPLTVMELQDALVYTNLIDPDAVNDPEGYDDGSTLAQIDELHRRLTT